MAIITAHPTDSDDVLALVFDYNSALLQLLKSVAPSQARRWNQPQKAWFVLSTPAELFLSRAAELNHKIERAQPDESLYVVPSNCGWFTSPQSPPPPPPGFGGFGSPPPGFGGFGSPPPGFGGFGYAFPPPKSPPPPQPPRTKEPAKTGRWADELLSAAPDALCPKIIRALSKVLHPDTGGDETLMKQLNTAAERAKRRPRA